MPPLNNDSMNELNTSSHDAGTGYGPPKDGYDVLYAYGTAQHDTSPVVGSQQEATASRSRSSYQRRSTGTRHVTKKVVKKAVRFDDYDYEHEIPHINDLSEEEIDAVWLSRDEHEAIRTKCKNILMFVNDEMTCNEYGICFRGLDQNTPEYIEQKAATYRYIYDSLHAIQQFQKTTGVSVSDEMIAETCQKLSAASTAAAHRRGMNDATSAIIAAAACF